MGLQIHSSNEKPEATSGHLLDAEKTFKVFTEEAAQQGLKLKNP